ncbi:MAG: type II toxin-antitoxin system RelE/ParE family toxin [Candidatus Paracaedimonas acanthamoebae]|uniref:Type II toxin-antitoxin system RelE/ParE family toxin n=1 Tax=Candidatus Paracaedimonas acanthamoebae TaxID=244581 RepID=A0A8J7Q158_9PROT|nr:type II toxin-antitoxin system RelE/ParE family toxin [Candidatus Paracaedimonas acanthamoebae]
MSLFIFSPAAKQDLLEIWEYIAEESTVTALKVLSTIEQKCHMLSEHPNLGHRRTDLTKHPVLFWPVYNYLIIYKQDTRPLEIVRILSGYRNLIELLQ